MLTNTQIESLAKRMKIPLEGVFFKSQLKELKMKPNRSYIINLEDEFDEEGNRNEGSHYTCFQYNKYPKGSDQSVYLDSYGVAPPQEVLDFCGVKKMPYNVIDIQSLMNSACGWYCLAFLHFINAWEGRTKDLYYDCTHFTSLFEDLNKSTDWKKNEVILKQFFKSPHDTRIDTPESVGFKWVPLPDEDQSVATGIANVNSIDSDSK
jgi:hypothetical protein